MDFQSDGRWIGNGQNSLRKAHHDSIRHKMKESKKASPDRPTDQCHAPPAIGAEREQKKREMGCSLLFPFDCCLLFLAFPPPPPPPCMDRYPSCSNPPLLKEVEDLVERNEAPEWNSPKHATVLYFSYSRYVNVSSFG